MGKWAKGLAVLLLLALVGGAARAKEEITVDAKAAILIDAQSGRALYERNADEPLPMASTTKIMTALLALENCSLEETVTAGANASGVTGTSIYLGVGEELSMKDMLLGLLIRSGNDAAVAVAEHVSGSVGAFAKRMNERAEDLGAQAHFVNPHGLDATGHEASARAMALIAREAMQNEVFRELVSTKEAIIPWRDSEYERVLRTKNRILSEVEGGSGVKTGYTAKAGRCLVFSAERGGRALIGAVLNCPNWFDEAERLLEWGFSTYTSANAASQGAMVAEFGVHGGETSVLGAVAEGDVRALVCEDDQWRVETELPDALRAPVRAGEEVGRLYLVLNGERVASTRLLASGSSARWGYFAAFRKVASNWALH